MLPKKELDKTNKAFDDIAKELSSISTQCKAVMPLVAQSLELTIELIRTYKEAFNAIHGKK